MCVPSASIGWKCADYKDIENQGHVCVGRGKDIRQRGHFLWQRRTVLENKLQNLLGCQAGSYGSGHPFRSLAGDWGFGTAPFR